MQKFYGSEYGRRELIEHKADGMCKQTHTSCVLCCLD
jgi:hypothetical protein